MAAVVFDRQRKNSIRDILVDIKDSDNFYYAGIGKSEDWNDSDLAPNPLNSLREQRLARLGIQSIKNITDQTFVVPRYNWTSGAIYSALDILLTLDLEAVVTFHSHKLGWVLLSNEP